MLASNADEIPAKSSDKPIDAIDDEYKDDENLDYADDTFKEERVEIADPLEPFNRAMHHFNDKLYFWALKPVAQGYKIVVPEPARISVKNFFSNLGFPCPFPQLPASGGLQRRRHGSRPFYDQYYLGHRRTAGSFCQ